MLGSRPRQYTSGLLQSVPPPVNAVIAPTPTPAKPATTKLFLSCVVKAIDGFAAVPAAVAAVPIATTPENSRKVTVALELVAKVTVIVPVVPGIEIVPLTGVE